MIITFYSYKGGVGRSMAMANVGAWLYRQGRRVLMVDWDLEAPGLESFFINNEKALSAFREKSGLMDLIEGYRHLWSHSSPSNDSDTKQTTLEEKGKKLLEQMGSIHHLFHPLAETGPDAIATREPGLWLLHAGCRAGESESYYTQSVNSLDWTSFYEDYGGYVFIEWLRREMEKDVDFVLIDSRTGITEMGGVCTQHLADIVIPFFAPNNSNLKGVRRITELLRGDKLKQLRKGRKITIFPIPCRVDTQGATTQLELFEKQFRSEFNEFKEIDLDWCWKSKIRYVTSYSYEEKVLFMEQTAHSDLVQSYERIGAQLVRLFEEKLPLEEREKTARFRSDQQGKREEDFERSKRTVQQLITTAQEKSTNGDFLSAASLLSTALTLAENDLGVEHSETISAMKNLTAALYAQGDFAGAKKLQERVLSIERLSLGNQSPELLPSINNLAGIMFAMGDLVGARSLQVEGLAMSRRILGNEHSDTLSAMGNLAQTLSAQGDLSGARDLQQQVLEDRRRILGNEHPVTLTAMNNLALILSGQGDLPGARDLHQQILEARRRILGNEHPATTISAWNLFTTLLDLQESDAAEEVHRNHLAWLQQADPDRLAANQVQIRQHLIDMLEQNS